MITTSYVGTHTHPLVPTNACLALLEVPQQLVDLHYVVRLLKTTQASELATADADDYSGQKIYEWAKKKRMLVDIVVVIPEIPEDIDFRADADGNLRRIKGNAFNLVESAVDFSDEESKREAALRSANPYGVWLKEFFAYLIVEVKKYRPLLAQLNLPVVLLVIAGNHLIVSTTIFTDSIYADELVSIKHSFGPHASDNIPRVARMFMVINRWTERLRRLFRILKTTACTTPPTKVMWPNRTTDPSESAEGIQGLGPFPK
ncbi:hypothetical protein BDM02DRAFT_3129588 [Thelephora ganbajun]|uniref:Uncharacterized protein n=1 Tax=Thelephora ganbajun TaxID=370292 RepID=A0ACB6ZDP2_THEGA|nr:hypothetical protein BDM02DRAFT_3129588 [Thelephora ganbajun]